MQKELEFKAYKVSELVALIKSRLEEVGEVWVEGEVSNLRQPSSGHSYFTLKDETAQLKVAFFRFHSQRIRFRLEDGIQLACLGKLAVYEQRGDLQLIATNAEPAGFGALQIAFEALKEKLAKEGLFDESRKTPIPLLPKRIGIVTSATGAALRDMLNVLGRRNEKVSVVIAPSRVQGVEAAAELTSRIEALNRLGGIDVIIIGRGGGSIEDLWPFNEEAVARAISASTVPIISAVGHEIDFTIADFVADLRAPTPSAAAELVSSSRREIEGKIEALRRSLAASARETTSRLRRRLARASADQLLAKMVKLVSQYAQRLDDSRTRMERTLAAKLAGLRTRLDRIGFDQRLRAYKNVTGRLNDRIAHLEERTVRSLKVRITQKRYAVEGFSGRLSAMDPKGILKRGYSICRAGTDGAVLKDSARVELGGSVTVELYRGRLDCEVKDKEGVRPDTGKAAL